MEAELAQGKLGDVGAYDVAFKDGKLVASAMASAVNGVGLALSADVKVEIGAEAVLDALAKAIPGTIDDALLGVIKAALKA